MRTEYRVDYDERGHVERFQQIGGDELVAYQRRKRGESLRTLIKEAQPALLTAIPEALRRASFHEPLYCLVLNYRSVEQYFPPYLLPGFAGERETLLARGERWQIWRPLPNSHDPWPLYPIVDPEALECCARLEQAIQTAQAWDLAARALRALGRDLSALDWSAIMPVTPDFVVYALDYEDDALPALRISAPPAQLRAWRQLGMLD
jgi:hypothetical protein